MQFLKPAIMQRYRYEIDNVRSHLRSLWVVIGLLLAVIFGFWIAWMRMPSAITVHIPPDLRAGAVLDLNEVPRANVYTFALYVFQQLNRWPEDGAEDYGKAIFRIAPYLTPNFREVLITDMQTKARQGELASRVRSLQAIPGSGFEGRRVDIVSSDVWVVWLDLELNESVKGMPVKRTVIRYPLRVVRYPVDAETNPWGLALDGFADDGPTRIDDAGSD
jgi:integrating conjugative element protein (TIGR03746 family)